MNQKQTKLYCPTCGHSFNSEEELLNHKETGALRTDEMVRCDECDGLFETREAFREHLQLHHIRQA